MTPTSCYTYVTAINGTDTRCLSDNYIWIEEDDGLGAPPNHDITERGPLQHGDTRIDYRLDPRIITHVFGVAGQSEGKLYDARKIMLDIFRARSPANFTKMRYELSNGDIRQIDCYYLSDMTFPSSDRQNFFSTVAARGLYQRIAVRLKCDDPVFYDPTQQVLVFDAGESVAGMVVPTPVPTRIGTTLVNTSTTINYVGSWREYPIVRIIGPITNALIRNATTDEILQLKPGVVIAAGNYYEIDCRYGQKTVKDSLGVNKIADLTDDSDLATFHIEERDPGFTTGLNTIEVSGSNITNATAIRIYYYVRYIGL